MADGPYSQPSAYVSPGCSTSLRSNLHHRDESGLVAWGQEQDPELVLEQAQVLEQVLEQERVPELAQVLEQEQVQELAQV